MTDPVDVILASASPRRRELLERIGLRLRVHAVDIDETPRPEEEPRAYAARLASEKASTAATRLAGEAAIAPAPILAADTVVVLERQIFGKPRDAEEAASMLARFAGRRHEVITAYCIHHAGMVVERLVSTAVTFRLISPAEVAAYVASGEWEGKAGGYAIQGIGSLFATDLRGSLTNVIGLPLPEVIADLRAAGALATYPPAAFGVSA